MSQGLNLVRLNLTRLRAQIIALVREVLESSDSPMLLARVSQYVVSRLGPQVIDTQWAGAGSFKRLLQTTEDLGLEVTTQPEPGYIFDPRRHAHPAMTGLGGESSEPTSELEISAETLPRLEAVEDVDIPETEPAQYVPAEPSRLYNGDEDEEEEEEEEQYGEDRPSLEEFIRRVSRVTGAPDLTSQQYALVFRGMIVELQQIASGQKSYNTYQSSKAVSEWCAEHGEPINRSDIVLIFKGIIFQDGVRFGKRPGSYTATDLASVVQRNIHALCRRSRLELTDYEEQLLEAWICGGLEEFEPVIAALEDLAPAAVETAAQDIPVQDMLVPDRFEESMDESTQAEGGLE